ncbi:MFS siderochrome iron transporter 1 [Arachnomyces sp. PD_36]|nr:MFS siderochrome iron transporter 1 [Arachnomyces sp. PD_36]
MSGNYPASSSSSGRSDLESQKTIDPVKVSHWRLLVDRPLITDAVRRHKYNGSGTDDDPYIVEFLPNDPRNPVNFSKTKKWAITVIVAIATLAVAFCSSAYSGGVREIIMQFRCSQEVATLGISLFVLGFAIGPLFWAPLSELYGRQILYTGTYCALTAFAAGCAGAQNIETLVILRFFAGAFGSSPLTNAGGVISDMFSAQDRGIATSIFAIAPFMGPVLGPIVGGFVGQEVGWRWVEGVMAIFAGVVWIVGTLAVPETYTPFLLRDRANALSKETGKVYISVVEAQSPKKTPSEALKHAILRPWALLFLEPIVLALSVYMAIIYGTLYMLFGAFPIVFQQKLGWSEGVGGLAFIGVAVGMLFGLAYSILDGRRYNRVANKSPNGEAPPEARLPPCIVASLVLPIGLFWFAWTARPSIHWIVPIIASAPFGFGMVLVFLTMINYLVDAYTIYAASVLAANSVLRSLFGAAFPLFTQKMYDNLGVSWASSIPAFLAVACVPFPFLFYKYGGTIRSKCKYAADAAAVMARMRQSQNPEKAQQEEDLVVAAPAEKDEQTPEIGDPLNRNSDSGVHGEPVVEKEGSRES